MTFRVGQKVVCIKVGRWEDDEFLQQKPVNGGIYTVRGFGAKGDSLLLVEIVNPLAMHEVGLSEPTWACTRFRPIVSRKTSIEIFTRMLTPQGVDA